MKEEEFRSQNLPDGRPKTVKKGEERNRECGEGMQHENRSLHGSSISIPTVVGTGCAGKFGITGYGGLCLQFLRVGGSRRKSMKSMFGLIP